jgi:acyl carrier protein
MTSVFPDIREDEIPNASAASLASWNSIAQVTLLSSLAEEFGIDFEVEDFEQLDSYKLIVEYLEKKSLDA